MEAVLWEIQGQRQPCEITAWAQVGKLSAFKRTLLPALFSATAMWSSMPLSTFRTCPQRCLFLSFPPLSNYFFFSSSFLFSLTTSTCVRDSTQNHLRVNKKDPSTEYVVRTHRHKHFPAALKGLIEMLSQSSNYFTKQWNTIQLSLLTCYWCNQGQTEPGYKITTAVHQYSAF